MSKSSKPVIEEVFRQYRDVKLAFETPAYWEVLRLTYERTISDIEELIRTRFVNESTIRILEIGSFCGIVSTAMKLLDGRIEVTACDLPMFQNDPALKAHFAAAGISSGTGDLGHLPLAFAAGTFDLVICCEVLEHLNFNPLPVFCEFNRLLGLGGILYIGTPNQANIVKRLLLARGKSIHNPVEHLIWQLNPEAAFSIGLHWKEYTAWELRQILTITGFSTLHSYYCHTNERTHPNILRRLFVKAMYSCFPSFLPSQVAIAEKDSSQSVETLRATTG